MSNKKVLFYTVLWNTAHCKTNNFWKLQFHKSRGYTSSDVIIFCVDAHIGLKLCRSSWIEKYFRTMPLCWCYLSREAQTSIFYERPSYKCLRVGSHVYGHVRIRTYSCVHIFTCIWSHILRHARMGACAYTNPEKRNMLLFEQLRLCAFWTWGKP